MSNRRRLSRCQSDMLARLGPLDGKRIPGGCDECDAYQVVTPGPVAGMWSLNVFHDATCPTLTGHEGRAS